jgi:hypothetical protein
VAIRISGDKALAAAAIEDEELCRKLAVRK